MFELFINLLNNAQNNFDNLNILQRLIDDAVVDINGPLQLTTIINLIERHQDSFNITIGLIDNDIPLNEYLSNENIPQNTSYQDFIRIVHANNKRIIANSIITNESIYVNE